MTAHEAIRLSRVGRAQRTASRCFKQVGACYEVDLRGFREMIVRYDDGITRYFRPEGNDWRPVDPIDAVSALAALA